MASELEDILKRIAELEQEVQSQGNRTRKLELDVPKGMMLPYFGVKLPSDDYVWADGKTNWPNEDWVPSHLREVPTAVPDMQQWLVGGAATPQDVGLVWDSGALTIAAFKVKGESFTIPQGTATSRGLSGNLQGLLAGTQSLGYIEYDGSGNPMPETRVPLPAGSNFSNAMMYAEGSATPEKPMPRLARQEMVPHPLSEVNYTDTIYSGGLTGEASFPEQRLNFKSADSMPRHVRCQWIIKIR